MFRAYDPATGTGVKVHRTGRTSYRLEAIGPIRLPPRHTTVTGCGVGKVRRIARKHAANLRREFLRTRRHARGGTRNWVSGIPGGNRRKKSDPVVYPHRPGGVA